MTEASDIVILQRLLPHYRLPLFQRLYNEFGLRVVAARTPPRGSFLKLANPSDHDFAIGADITFPDPNDMFSARVPVDWILNTIQPRAMISEFGLKMNSSYRLPIARRTGKLRKLAFWTHGWQMERGFSTVGDLAIQAARIPLLSCADVIATYSQEGSRWADRWLPFTEAIALGNALDSDAFQKAALDSPVLRAGDPQFLAIGRLTADKAIGALFEIFDLLQKRWPNAALTVIGDGRDRARLKALAGNRLGTSIKLPGAIHDEALIAPHFLGADLLIVPGSAGLSINHALGYNLPVAAFARMPNGPRHHPEIEYVVDDVSGLLVREPTVNAMSDAIIAFIEAGRHIALRRALAIHNPAPKLDAVVGHFRQLIHMLA